MSPQIRISAKNLGEVALDSFCPRCFWIKLKLRHRLPFQIFPGIFSSIDSYNKRIVHSWFNKNQSGPVWLKELGELSGYREPPHYTKFQILNQEYNILLTGSPDGVFVRSDKSHIIVDYKTARYTGAQDLLFPMYEAQLNVYAMIGEQTDLSPVSGLALIYMEPMTDDAAASDRANHRDEGFLMGFKANVHDVPVDPDIVLPLLAKTRQIYELNHSPSGLAGCKDCELLNGLFRIASVSC